MDERDATPTAGLGRKQSLALSSDELLESCALTALKLAVLTTCHRTCLVNLGIFVSRLAGIVAFRGERGSYNGFEAAEQNRHFETGALPRACL